MLVGLDQVVNRLRIDLRSVYRDRLRASGDGLDGIGNRRHDSPFVEYQSRIVHANGYNTTQ